MRSVLAGSEPVLPTRHEDGALLRLQHDSTAIDRAALFTIESTPLYTVGGAAGDPEFDLTYVNFVELLSSGGIVTQAGIGSRLLVFEADGKPERRVGRQGSGPGEFMAMAGMALMAGDTVLVADAANARLNWIDPHKGIVRTASLDAIGARSPRFLFGVLPTGEMLFTSGGGFGGRAPDSLTRSMATVALRAVDGTTHTVLTLPDLDIAPFETRYRGVIRAEGRPIGFSRLSRGRPWDALLVTSVGEGFRLDLWTAKGRSVGSIELPRSRRPVTAAMRDADIRQQLARFGSGGERMVDRAESERQVREGPYADSLPPYRGLFVTPAGTLWAVDYVSPTDSSWSATAFRRDGAIVGRLVAPIAGFPATFGDDRVVVRSLDEDGVVTLAVYRIVPVKHEIP
ncbi:MAG: 6-bladed beta-propeller [Gemmatimonadota bacterium]